MPVRGEQGRKKGENITRFLDMTEARLYYNEVGKCKYSIKLFPEIGPTYLNTTARALLSPRRSRINFAVM
jgi:hypothetical protein